MYAIFRFAKVQGKQYKVSVGDIIKVDKLNANPKDKVEIDSVLAIQDGENLSVGTPLIDGAKVVLEVISTQKEKKIVIFKKRRRKDSKLKKGFRRQTTSVKVIDIIK